MSISINSGDLLENFDQNVKIIAGPGSGKTYWLVNNIKHILINSNRLGKSRKIGCITHTNTAVETLIKRLDISTDKISISTIHSFLYKNVVKPYISFVANEYSFNYEKLRGHDDVTISRGIVTQWLNSHPNKEDLKNPFSYNQLVKFPDNLLALRNWLKSLSFSLDSDKKVYFSYDNSKALYLNNGSITRINTKTLNLLMVDLKSFKELYWSRGIMSHDDVLFFSYIILTKFDFVLNVLRAKFPYLYIDEFQDSHPIQVEIIKLIAEKETNIGIIGDTAQSIYEFQGSNSSQLLNFNLDNIQTYTISDNRRSTNQIVGLLNSIRSDLIQNPFRNVSGGKPILLIGSINNSLIFLRENLGITDFVGLSRNNETVLNLQKLDKSSSEEVDLLHQIKAADKNIYRLKTILSFITSIEYCIAGKFKKSLSEMMKNKDIEKDALLTLIIISSQYSTLKSKSLFEFIKKLKEDFNVDIPTPNGETKRVYESIIYSNFALSIFSETQVEKYFTIHKSKGEEYNNVFLVDDNLDYLLDFDIQSEEHRIRYVAMSRARENLIISILSLDAEIRNQLVSKFIIHDV
ncbi:UvrD-helicase domain-containing protein [Acinetobacter seifertii]|uniref:UvrD-helicase domain-containing protein n=1 Tax=Acinetobacter seifertii TaxID=1530123 RepID=UPI00168CB66B|nr:ATP-dependent helicase [Acinetobacter seifertii]QNX28924.1 ATP-dependent helicase [Acinetobacter seifertii]